MRSFREMASLQGRVAVVTGGSGHIGRALCDTLAELGAAVAVVDRAENVADFAVDLTERWGVPGTSHLVDLADEETLRDLPATILERHGRIDVLVHSAALVGTSDLEGWIGPFERQSAATWREALEINLTSSFILSQACAPALRDSGHGSIISIASIYGLVGPDLGLYEDTGMGNPAAYAASKGGLLQLTRWMATVLAPEIRVNSISPGGVWRHQDSRFRERYESRTPLGRMATEEDLKGAVAFLASDLSSYVTGQNLIVDGGFTAW